MSKNLSTVTSKFRSKLALLSSTFEATYEGVVDDYEVNCMRENIGSLLGLTVDVHELETLVNVRSEAIEDLRAEIASLRACGLEAAE